MTANRIFPRLELDRMAKKNLPRFFPGAASQRVCGGSGGAFGRREKAVDFSAAPLSLLQQRCGERSETSPRPPRSPAAQCSGVSDPTLLSIAGAEETATHSCEFVWGGFCFFVNTNQAPKSVVAAAAAVVDDDDANWRRKSCFKSSGRADGDLNEWK